MTEKEIFLVMTKDDEIIGVYHTKENAEMNIRKGFNDYVTCIEYDD